MLKYTVDGKEYELPEVPDSEIDRYRHLGTAEGQDPNHCLYMARKHLPGFDKRVAGYRHVSSLRGAACSISFYERKPFEPVEVKGEPLSEQIRRERR